MVASYVAAFPPWVVHVVVDHVGGRWRKVEDLRWNTTLAIWVCIASIAWLTIYSSVQFGAGDWKEAMTAVVVLVAAWQAWHRFSRQSWLVSASWSLGHVLNTLPHFVGFSAWDAHKPLDFDAKGAWSSGNSYQLFDNDDPGEGGTNLSLVVAWLLRRQHVLAQKQLQNSSHCRWPLGDDFFPGREIPDLYDVGDCELAMDVVRLKLRIIAASDYKRPNKILKLIVAASDNPRQGTITTLIRWRPRCNVDTLPVVVPQGTSGIAKTAENGLTRSLWLYENLTGQIWLSEERKKRGTWHRSCTLGWLFTLGWCCCRGLHKTS